MNVNARFPVCWWHRRSLTLMAADRLSPASTRRVQAHLGNCPACRMRWERLTDLVRRGQWLAGALPMGEPSAGMNPRWEGMVLACPVRADRSAIGYESRPVFEMTGRRLAWATLAAAWVTIGFLRWSAPDVATPEVERAPISWGQVQMVLAPGVPRSVTESATARDESPAQEPTPGANSRGDRGEVRKFRNRRNA